jgi:WD40 repeat protein
MENNEFIKLKSHSSPVTALAVDYSGNIYSWGSDNRLKHWNLKTGCIQEVNTKNELIPYLKIYPQGRIMALSEKILINDKTKKRRYKQKIKIIDLPNKSSYVFSLPFRVNSASINVYYDGRIISGLSAENKTKHNLAVLTPGIKICKYKFLEGHEQETRGCLCMGPKIISCGKEKENIHTIRIWGTEFYVRTQVSKLSC